MGKLEMYEPYIIKIEPRTEYRKALKTSTYEPITIHFDYLGFTTVIINIPIPNNSKKAMAAKIGHWLILSNLYVSDESYSLSINLSFKKYYRIA